ncbi:unnamed protein product [Clonostachys rhizophaga]|uniref:Inositol polyphosphate-related phosphatase domain-containing protein n=1 Tax=Clonostachys rhizophaga TaxID=160324 RepID=A0A9N9YGR4_9HYPO|nr:unnamed protein product [Clonostachys rhizophaga]
MLGQSFFAFAACVSGAAAASGSFSFLTINVAGLPAWMNDNGVPGDKTTNAKSIGTRFSELNYDIIHMQEDFQYHAAIYSTDTHPYRTPTTGTVVFGSGLNSVANYDWTGLTRVTWNKCNLNSGDCLTPKGFTYMRMVIQGVEVDLYNLHADAGSDSGDVDARSAGIDQILAYVNANSQGRAVIIGGDTNDRWTNAGRSINKLTDAGFTDSWVSLIKKGTYPTAGATADPCGNPADDNDCEIVDKVFFRSGSSVKLSATSFSYVGKSFLQSDGNILTDHNPVLVQFSFTS